MQLKKELEGWEGGMGSWKGAVEAKSRLWSRAPAGLPEPLLLLSGGSITSGFLAQVSLATSLPEAFFLPSGADSFLT